MFTRITPNSPYYFFVPRDESNRFEYESFASVTDIFPTYVSAPVTARDHFVIAIDRDKLLERIARLGLPALPTKL